MKIDLRRSPLPQDRVRVMKISTRDVLVHQQNVNCYPQKRPVFYYQETLLSVQHEIPGQVLLDVS
jgi:hypothetical protein